MDITVGRILLQLDSYERHRKEITAPYTFTQEGISQTIGKERSYVSKILRRLENEGILTSEKRHVKGRTRKMSAYYLTTQGVTSREDMDEKEGKRDKLVISSEKPHQTFFVGREKEKDTFKKWRNSTTSYILVVKGMAGIGKTSFISKSIDSYAREKHIFWHRLSEWSTVNSLLQRLSEFLSSAGRDGLEHYLAGGRPFNLVEASFLLENELTGLNGILVIDDYHNTKSKEINDLLGSFVEFLPRTDSVKLIVIGREVPRFHYDISSINITHLVKEVTLAGLDIDGASKMLERENVDIGLHEKLFLATRGHPLALALMARTKDQDPTATQEFIEEAISTSISYEEKVLLDIASLLRRPGHPNMYVEIANNMGFSDVEYGNISSLYDKSLFYQTGDSYGAHELIKSFSHGRIRPSLRRTYHREIAKYFDQNLEDEVQDTLEQAHHLLMAEEYDDVAIVMRKRGRNIIHKGFWEEVLDIIKNIPEDVDEESCAWMLTLKAYILYEVEGKLDPAIKIYENAQKTFVKNGNKRGELETFMGIGGALVNKGEFPSGVEAYGKAVEIARSIGDERALADVKLGEGLCLAMAGQVEEGLKILEELWQEHEAVDYPHEYALLNNLSMVYIMQGRNSKAREYLKQIITNEDIGPYNSTRIHSLIGLSYAMDLQNEEALVWLKTSLEMAQRNGYIRRATIVLVNTADAYMNMGDPEKALEYLEMATPLADRTGGHVKQGVLSVKAEILFKKGSMDESAKLFEEALAIESDEPFVLSQIHMLYGKFLDETGKKEKACASFNKCIGIAQRVGNAAMEKEAKAEMKDRCL